MVDFSKFNSLFSIANYFSTDEICKQTIIESRWGKDEAQDGDIHIDFKSGRVFYTEKKSRYTYTLEPDNRTKKQWDALLEQLKMSLDNRI